MPSATGTAPVNGLALYYEIHGSGLPLVLIHGGFGAIPFLGPIVLELAKSRQVMGIELQGHGRTGDIDRPLTFEFLADDVAGLLKYLGIGQADVMGYSLGAAVGLHVAFGHPGALRKLVVVTTPMKSEGWYPETLVGFAQLGPGSAAGLKQTPLYSTYASLAPDPSRWEALHDKYHNLLAPGYGWSERVRSMTMPTLLVFGDSDAVRLSHMVEFYELLGGGQKDGGWDRSGVGPSRLAVLPGATHYDILSSPLLAPAVKKFLDQPV
jgi:pimeloyl-ACP methyl ester carboxylesterase